MEKCSVCDLSYITKQKYEEHKLSLMHHIKLEQKTGQQEHTCDLCSATFPTLGGYSKHLNEEVHRSAQKAQKELTDIQPNEKISELKGTDMGKPGIKTKKDSISDSKITPGDKEKVQGNNGAKKKSKKKKKKQSAATTESSKSDSGTNKGKNVHQACDYGRSRFDQFSDNWCDDFEEGAMYNEHQHSYSYSHSAGEETGQIYGPPDFSSDNFLEQYPTYKNFNNNRFWQSSDRPGFPGPRNQRKFYNWTNPNNNSYIEGNPEGFEEGGMGFPKDMFYHGRSRPMNKPTGKGKMVGPNIRKGSSKSHQVSLHVSLERNSRDRSVSMDKGTSKKQGNKQRSSSLSGKKTTNLSSASEDSQPEGSKTLSLKAGRLIDNILKGKAPKHLLGSDPSGKDKVDKKTTTSTRIIEKPPKAPKQHQQNKEKSKQSKAPQAQIGKTSSCKDNPNRGAYLLDRAESLCREIREKRELAKKGNQSKTSLHDGELSGSTSSLWKSSLNSSISSSHQWLESSADNLSTPINVLTAGSKKLGNSAGSKDIAIPSSTATKETAMLSTSLKRPSGVPHLPGRVRQCSESCDKERRKDKLDKETILKLVNSPRSRKERLQVGKILRTFTKQQKQRPKLSLVNAVERQEESESEVNLDELPEDIKNQINQLIEEELDSLDPQETADKGLTVESIQTSLGIDPSSSVSESTSKESSHNKETVIDLLDEDSNDALEITSVRLSSAAAKKKGSERNINHQRKEDQSFVSSELSGQLSGSNPRSTDSPLTLNDLTAENNLRIDISSESVVSIAGENTPAVTSASSVQQSVEAYMASDHVRSLTASMLNTTFPLDKGPIASTGIGCSSGINQNVNTGLARDTPEQEQQVPLTVVSVPAPMFQNYMDIETSGVLAENDGQGINKENGDSESVTMPSGVQPVSVADNTYSMFSYQSDLAAMSGSASTINTSFTDNLQKNEFGQFVIEPESSEHEEAIRDAGRPINEISTHVERDDIQVGNQVDERRHQVVDKVHEENMTADCDTGSSGDKNGQAHKRRRSERSPAVQIAASGCDSNSSGNKVDVKRFRADSEVAEVNTDHGSTIVDEEDSQVSRGSHQTLQDSYSRNQDCVNTLYELSMQEESVRQQLGNVDRELQDLQELLSKTRQKIQDTQKHKERLLKEEHELRRKRLLMLKGAVNNQGYLTNASSLSNIPYNRLTSTPDISSIATHSNDPYNNYTSTPTRSLSYEGPVHDTGTPTHIEPLTIFPDNGHVFERCDSRDTTNTCEIVPRPCVPSTEESVPSCHVSRSRDVEQDIHLQEKPLEGSRIEEADSTMIQSISPDRETCAADSSSHVRENKETDKHVIDFVINNHSAGSSEPDGKCIEDLTDNNAGDEGTKETDNLRQNNDGELSAGSSNLGPTVQYMGSFSVPGNDSAFLHKLVENFAELKQKPFMFLESTDAQSTEGASKEQSETITRSASRDDSPANTSVDTVVANPTSRSNNADFTNQECEGDGETEIPTDTGHMSHRVKSPKRRKSKKTRASQSLQENPSTSEGEDMNTSYTTNTTTTTTGSSSPSRRSRKKKFGNPLETQLVKEYLHAESSTDVEINGLEPKLHKAKAMLTCSDIEKEQNAEISLHDAAITCMCMWKNTLITGSEDCTVKRTSFYHQNPAESKTTVIAQWDKKVQCVHVSNSSGSARVYAAWENSCLTVYSYKSCRWMTQTKSFGQDLLCLHERWGILFVGMSKGSILCYDIKANKQSEVLNACERAITQLSSVEDIGGRELLVVASADCSVTVRHRCNGALVYSVEGHTKTPLALHIEQDLVYSGGMDRCLQVHKWKSGDMENIVQLGGVIRNIYITGEDIYVVLQNGCISCYCSKTLKVKYKCFGSQSSLVLCSTLDPSTTIYCGLKNGSVRKHSIWKRQVLPCQVKNGINNYIFCEKDLYEHLAVSLLCIYVFGRCDSLLGSKADLEQHLLQDHVLPHEKIMCLWKDCPNVYLVSSQPQKVKEHLQSHLE